MPIAIGLRPTGALRSRPIAELANFIRAAGLGALDLPADFRPGIAACDAHGVRVGSVDFGQQGRLLSPDDTARSQAVEALIEHVRQMASAGAHVLFLCLVPEDDHQPIKRSLAIFAETFPAVAAACDAVGVRIALEGWPGPSPYHHTLGYTPEHWRAMFAAVPSPALGLCYDPSHLIRLGIDHLRVLEEFRDRIHHCHGKDAVILEESRYLYGHYPPAIDNPPAYAGGAWRYCIPGTGVVDWSRVAYDLERIGYQGCVCIELEDGRFHGSAEREEEGVRAAYAHLAAGFR